MNDDDRYRNPDLLWSHETMPAQLKNPSLRLIDVRPGERFAMGHIPNARHFDIYAVNCDDTDDAPLLLLLLLLEQLEGSRVAPSGTRTEARYLTQHGPACPDGAQRAHA